MFLVCGEALFDFVHPCRQEIYPLSWPLPGPGECGGPAALSAAPGLQALYRALLAHRETSVLRGHTAEVRRAAFSPDGNLIATASSDGTARAFNVYPTTEELIDHARTIVVRELTPCERKRFFLPVEGEVGDCSN